jgi:hypothetical protein
LAQTEDMQQEAIDIGMITYFYDIYIIFYGLQLIALTAQEAMSKYSIEKVGSRTPLVEHR